MQYWDDLRFLLALDDHKNMKKAAQFLRADPTTVSRRIKRLNEVTNSTLVSLSGQGQWELTPEGRRYVGVARDFQENLTDLRDDESSDAESEIVVSTTSFLVEEFLVNKLPEIHALLGDTRISINADDRKVSLAYGEADLALRMSRPSDGRLIVSRVGQIEFGVFAPEQCMEDGWIGLSERYDDVPEMKLGFEFFGKEPTIRIGSFRAILEASLASGLCCIGPVHLFSDLLTRIDETGAQREIWSAIHETKRHDSRLQVVRSWARSCMQTQTKPS